MNCLTCSTKPFGRSPYTYRLAVNGKEFYFDWSETFGPLPVTETGKEINNGPRQSFWDAVTLWNDQGRKVGENGLCIWSEPPDIMDGAIHLGGRNWTYSEKLAAEVRAK